MKTRVMTKAEASGSGPTGDRSGKGGKGSALAEAAKLQRQPQSGNRGGGDSTTRWRPAPERR